MATIIQLLVCLGQVAKVNCFAIPTPVPTIINASVTGNLASLGVVIMIHSSSFYFAVHFQLLGLVITVTGAFYLA